MTDIPDEAVEAALDAWIGPSWRDGPPAAIAHSKADMRAALAAADAKRWRPISEAPTDGTRFLFWNGGLVGIGFYIQGKHFAADSFAGQTAQNPTHWQPLPPPPKEGE